MQNEAEKIISEIDSYSRQIVRNLDYISNHAIFQTVLLILILWRVW